MIRKYLEMRKVKYSNVISVCVNVLDLSVVTASALNILIGSVSSKTKVTNIRKVMIKMIRMEIL